MERIYLHVPPEEYPEVKAAGASWDDQLKVWYITGTVPSAAFSRWLEHSGDEAEFGITSDEACVASVEIPCLQCGETIDVICIHCQSGADNETGESMTRFTVSNIRAMDEALSAQLGAWPHFKRMNLGSKRGDYANHCPHCGAHHEDYVLHDEPGDVFFGIAESTPGTIKLTPLAGRVRLSGDTSRVI
ncbi:MAG TPA: DUF5710 domain-containing protein [Steroidobacteraceae bacterium]